MMINNNTDLKNICERLKKSDFVTIDTEFIREKTFYPILCLIQIASPEEAHCIDPLAEGIDLSPFYEILKDPKIVKVFHACRQDIEIFYHLAKIIPSPLFDTQIAAMAFGYPESVAYRQLVEDFLKVSLNKSARFTDWSVRPLSKKQIEYALHDVTYLRDIYLKLKVIMEDPEKKATISEEMALLQDLEIYDPSPETIWQRFKCPFHKGAEVAIFQKLCVWREKMARKKDKTRRSILKDEAILELCALQPQTKQDFEKMRSFPKNFSESLWVEPLLKIIQEALDDVQKNPEKFHLKERKPLSARQKNLAEFIKLLLEIISEKKKLAPKLIASADDIYVLASGQGQTKCSEGWRYEIFGKEVERLKRGEICFYFNPHTNMVEIKGLLI